jgi:hypothetical protein
MGRRTYRGEKEAKLLFAWLKKHRHKKAARDVTKVFEYLDGMREKASSLEEPTPQFRAETDSSAPLDSPALRTAAVYPAAPDAGSKGLAIPPLIVRKLNKILGRYPVHLSFVLPQDAPLSQGVSQVLGGYFPRASGKPWFQLVPERAAGALLFRLLWISGSDLLWKVRRCVNCREWFFSKQEPSQRCENCQKKHIRESDEWKSWRARKRFEEEHRDEIPMNKAEALAWYLERKAARAASLADRAAKTRRPKRKGRG